MLPTFLKLIALKAIDPNLTWENFCESPIKLFEGFTEHFGVEAKFLDNLPQVIVTAKTPSANDRSKLWIKTSWPYAIGVFIDGEYKFDYGLSGFPVGIPFLYLFTPAVPIPAGVEEISAADLVLFGMTNTNTDITVATKRKKWYIFQPETVTV